MLMSQSNFNAAIASVQDAISNLGDTAQATRKELLLPLQKVHALIEEMIKLGKHNRALEIFLETIARAMEELYVISESIVDHPSIERPKAILQYLATLYQDTIVPMLTRLHNLAEDTGDMLRITSLASLGNEIMTCSNQISQFSGKMDTTEQIYGMLGITLMMTDVALTIAILSGTNIEITTPAPLTLMTLGCALCSLSIKQHDNDPEVDLARKAILNTDKSIQTSKEALLEPSTVADQQNITPPKKNKSNSKTTITLDEDIIEEIIEVATIAESEKTATATEKPGRLTTKFLSAIGFIKNFNSGNENNNK